MKKINHVSTRYYLKKFKGYTIPEIYSLIILNVDWKYLAIDMMVTKEILIEFGEQFNEHKVNVHVCTNHTFKFEHVEYFEKYMDWNSFTYECAYRFKHLPEWFLDKYKYDLPWDLIYDYNLAPPGYSVIF